MSYTVVASWDFRGSDSAATKRNSKVGAYTLTEGGTPTWSSAGVQVTGMTDRLTLTLPSELKYTTDMWIIASIERTGTAAAFENYFGYAQQDTSGNANWTLAFCEWNTGAGETALRYALSQTVGDGLYTTSATPPLNTPTVITISRRDNVFEIFKDGSSVATKTDGGSLQYTATSHLAVGSKLGDNAAMNTRFHWIAIGTGQITASEVAAIEADPNTTLSFGGGTQSLTPDSTISNTSWTAVGAATLHAALASGDADYIESSTNGAVATVSLTDPVPNLTALTSVVVAIRHRVT